MRRSPAAGRNGSVLRLEGLVIQKRFTRVETTRYLVMDFNSGSISVYKRPPPKDEFHAMQNKRAKSVPSKFVSSVAGTLTRSSSDDGGCTGNVTCENLAHISKQQRHFSGAWDPKFTVPSTVDWKIRDVENDETAFYLVLPGNYKKKDSEAEVFALERQGRRVSYRSLKDFGGLDQMDSIKEDKAMGGGTSLNSPGGRAGARRSSNGDDDDSSVTSSGSKKSGLFGKTFKRTYSAAEEQETVYQFRVLLDGNEKFIWLQAAAELGRLSNESAISLTSATVDVTKKLFILPGHFGAGRSKSTALRYAEWARLIDQKKNVSKFHFDVHDIKQLKDQPQDAEDNLEDSGRYNSTRLVKVIPTYAYRNRRMTEKDLYYEMTTESEKWEDFRGQAVGDREEEEIGCLHAEVLACHGLPKLDKLSSTDAVCYFVCGPYAFATDVIDGFLSPVWPSKSRRACIFPMFHAYQKLYVGVFDDDGLGAHDDFAGRVVVDMARLRPNSVYDVFLPLRLYQNAFVKKSRGVIHLRLRVEWYNEKRALLSYLKRPTKTDQLGNAVTLNCADLKAFRNAVLTVQGKDVPGRYKPLVQKGLQREMKLYKTVMKTSMKEQMMDIVLYVHPATSFCIFLAWMHCVYSNSMTLVPVYFVAGIIALLMRNYYKYGVDEEFNFGFSPITVTEMLKVLIWGGPGTRYIKPIKVTQKSETSKSARAASSNDELDGEELMHQSVFDGAGFRMDGDHMEFPFSEAGRYPKKTLSEACVDASAMFLEDDEEDSKSPSKFSSLSRKTKKSSNVLLPKAMRGDDDEDDEEDEFGLMVKSSIPNANGSIAEVPMNGSVHQSISRRGSRASQSDVPMPVEEVREKTWKRVTDPRGLPEQDASVFVKARKTLKEDIIHNKDLLHKYSQRLFDDRMYIIDENDPGYKAGGELALNQAIGVNKYKSPIVAKVAEYVAPGLEMLKVGLSVWRAGFNLFMWKDPFLTSIFFFGAIFLLLLLLVFPWRMFFFAMGFGAVGPQNWVVRVAGLLPKKKKKPTPQKAEKSKKKKTPKKSPSNSLNYFHFHNHCMTDAGFDRREQKENKSSECVHRAIVPNSPLISRRFYDWPPNPSLSKVDIYSK